MPLILSTASAQLNDRLAFCQSGSSPVFSADKLLGAIDNAVEEYTARRPFVGVETLNLVPDQQQYSWPETAIAIEPFLFSNWDNPGLEYGTSYEAAFYSRQFSQYFESPALVARADGYFARFVGTSQGSVHVDKVRRLLFVNPVPKESKEVLVPVALPYEKTGSSPNQQYADIPSDDVTYILDWAQAILLRRIAMGYLVNDQKVGDRDFRGQKVADGLKKDALELETRFSDHFYVAVVARS